MPKPIVYIQVAPQGKIQISENGSEHQTCPETLYFPPISCNFVCSLNNNICYVKRGIDQLHCNFVQSLSIERPFSNT